MKKFYALGIIAIVVVACATNPLTGRKSLALVDNNQLIPMALQQYNTVLSESKVVTGTTQAQQIQNVGMKLKVAAEQFYQQNNRLYELQNYNWQFTLIEDEQLNAWCMPGGKVAFYTGILPVCKDETGIAVVMGHEIAHALAGHGAERVSQGMVAQYGGAIAGASITNAQWSNIFQQLYPTAAQATILSYSRKQELDADKAGLFLMAMAGFDPREAPKFWERMDAATQGQQRPPEFLSTHPAPERRRGDLDANMNEALGYYTKAIVEN